MGSSQFRPASPDTSFQTWLDAVGAGSSTDPIGGTFWLSAYAQFPGAISGKTFDARRATLKMFAPGLPSNFLLLTKGGSAFSTGTVAAGGIAAVASITADGSKGDTQLALTGAGTVVPGFYIVNMDTKVTHNGSGTVQYAGRQLVKITAVGGGVATLDSLSALVQDFTSATLHNVDTKVMEGCTIYLPNVRGCFGEGQADALRMASPLWLGYLYNCDVYYPRVNGSSDSAVKFALCCAVNVYYPNAIHILGSSTRYGVECYSCAHMVVDGGRGWDTRMFNQCQGGCGDITYKNAVHRQDWSQLDAEGLIDVGHGFGDQDIHVESCIGTRITIANPSWRLGSFGAEVTDCDCLQLQVYPLAEATISGCTVGELLLHTEPDGSDGLGDLTVTSCDISNTTFAARAGHACASMTGSGDHFLPDSLTFTGCTFTQGEATDLIADLTHENPTGTALLSFTNCTFNSSGADDYISLGGSGDVDVTLDGCNFQGSTGYPLTVGGTITGTATVSGCVRTISGTPTEISSGDLDLGSMSGVDPL